MTTEAMKEDGVIAENERRCLGEKGTVKRERKKVDGRD